MKPTHIIIDSSVAVKWYLPDEQNDQALMIKSDFTNRSIKISIPLLFYYEVNNILKTTTNQARIDEEKAFNSYKALLDLEFITHSSKELFHKALEKAFALNITAYDASYVVLSEHLQIPLYTSDEKLVKKAKNKLVLPLTAYSK